MLSLPHYKQKTLHDCGATCLQMIFEYFENVMTQEELSTRLNAGPDTWVSNEELEIVAREACFYTKSMTNATLEDLTTCIDSGIPTIINYIDPDDHEGHFAVVVDYTNEYLILNDPWYGKDFPLPLSYVVDNWRSFEGNWPQWLLAISKEKIAV